jgi:hypothetical protein
LFFLKYYLALYSNVDVATLVPCRTDKVVGVRGTPAEEFSGQMINEVPDRSDVSSSSL